MELKIPVPPRLTSQGHSKRGEMLHRPRQQGPTRALFAAVTPALSPAWTTDVLITICWTNSSRAPQAAERPGARIPNRFPEPGARPATAHSWDGQQAPALSAATHPVFCSFHYELRRVIRASTAHSHVCGAQGEPPPRPTQGPWVGGLFCTEGGAALAGQHMAVAAPRPQHQAPF